MKVISIDLELNQPSNTIIQIGAVVGDVLTGEVIDFVSIYVKTEESINPYIVSLTGVTQENVQSGLPLWEAYKIVAELHEKHKCFRNALTWGGGDTQLLYEQLGKPEKWCLGRRWLDTKTIFQAYCLANGIKIQSGLAKSMTKLDMRFKGRKHDAKDDALNTFLVYSELVKRMRK